MTSSEQLGERIADARKRGKLTQAELAHRVGVSRTTLVAMEKGERRPTNTEVVAIAATLLTALRVRLVTTPRAAGEVLFRYGPPDEEGQRSRVPIELNGLVSVDLLEVLELDATMSDHLVNAVTAGLRDADASVVALAQALGQPLVSDDNKVRKVSARLDPAPPLDSTLGLVRRAAGRCGRMSTCSPSCIAPIGAVTAAASFSRWSLGAA